MDIHNLLVVNLISLYLFEGRQRWTDAQTFGFIQRSRSDR